MLAEAATEFRGLPDQRSTAQAAADRIPSVVADADHASVVIGNHRRYSTWAASSSVALRLDELQLELDDGPRTKLSAEARWFRSGDLVHDQRWPRWGPASAPDRVHSVLSVALVMGTRHMGSLSMYADDYGQFADPDVALLYAVHVAGAIATSGSIANLEEALGSRHAVGMAQGTVMQQYGLDADSAFKFLQRLSNDSNRKLTDVAADLVARAQG